MSNDFDVVEGESDVLVPNVRATTPYMTHYEYARVLGVRALQLTANHTPQVELNGCYDPLKIAINELREGKVKLVIRRTLPDGTKDDWNVKDMHIPWFDTYPDE